ncbi:acyltransferase [Caulobacter phage C1]|nr:acyltransferase [Caulobacter phage C1]UTU08618.1 acyltransferase [Caulobacter phage C2]UTU09133.1 acyltransferase [Caulobacter phage J4]UTU10251.1 acyltransferase [Caulobacter phage RB23]WGN97285.1 acyltransferase [Bertelyvirus sp.]
MANTRFEVLDALRGVAAIAVVLYHLGLAVKMPLAHHGWVAVDFFFMLSGFIIAHAYDKKLAGGLSTKAFMVARLKRLWPLHLAGMILGLGVYVFMALSQGKTETIPALTLLAVAGAFFVPIVAQAKMTAFILNVPAWSLFYEMVANLAYAAGFKLTGKRVLAALSFLGLAGLGADAAVFGMLDVGWSSTNLLGGLARILFAFPLGALIYRLHVEGRFDALRKVSPTVLLLAFVAIVWMPFHHSLPIDLLIIVLVFPPFLILAARARFTAPSPVLIKLGDLSYAVYATHMASLTVASMIAAALGLPALTILISMPLVLTVAWAAQKLTTVSYKKTVDTRLARA